MKINLKELEKYNYDKRIFIYLNDIFEIVLKIVGINNIYSIILIGSTSRGELSYFSNEDGSFDILSDIEFIVILKKSIKADKSQTEELKDSLNEYKKKLNIKSPLFDIDFGISTYKKYKYTPNTLWSYEVQKNGLIVYGEDARLLLTKTNINNLDIGNLNELIIVRLWNMLLYIPNSFLYDKSNNYEELILKYFYSRNILDILTIYYPHKKILKEGYKNRLDIFMKDEDLYWNDLKQNIIYAHEYKLELKDKISLRDAQNTFFYGFLKLILFITDTKMKNIIGFNTDKVHLYIEKSKKSGILKEGFIRRLRRMYIESKIFIYFLNNKHYLFRSFKWLLRDIRYDMLGFLLLMHASIIKSNNENKKGIMKSAIEYYNLMSNEKYEYIENYSFEENWIFFRKKALEFMLLWFYSRSNVRKDKLMKIINWSDN